MKIRDIDVDISVIYKPTNKNIYFKYKNNTLYITVNTKYQYNHIDSLIKKNEDVIYKFLQKVYSKQTNERSDSIHLFGKEYKLIVKVDYKYFVKLNNDSIEIHTSTNTKKQVESILYDFYLHQLIEYINSIYSEAIRDFIDVKKLYYFNDSPLIKYSKVKTYFGKCYPKRNLIVLNVLLAKYDKIYIKSVLYHELCHYSYLDHQAGFYKLYESKFKNARKIQHELKQIKYNDLL